MHCKHCGQWVAVTDAPHHRCHERDHQIEPGDVVGPYAPEQTVSGWWLHDDRAAYEALAEARAQEAIAKMDQHLPEDAKARKEAPMARGLLDYFPDALAEVAHTSFVANEQHNPGEEMHWAKEKSNDHADCIIRHLADRGTLDNDGLRHSAKVAWRALALLQIEIEKEREDDEDKRQHQFWSGAVGS